MQNHKETAEQSAESQQSSDTSSPLNLVRAIFLGDTATGKSSLTRRLKGETVIEGEEALTQGVDIHEWLVPNTSIKAKLWDFGGKLMAHSTHQFFLRERCLYVVLLNATVETETESKQTANDQAEYWLEHIKSFANSAPVLLVGNKADETIVDLDMDLLSKKYANIIGFHSLSCLSQEIEFEQSFEQFTAEFIKQLKLLKTHEVSFTQKQFAALDKIRELSRNNAFLDQEKFDEICAEYGIGEKGLDKSSFLTLLDDVGEIVHFAKLGWSEAYAFSPRWITYGIYTLLYSDDVIRQNGVLRHADVARILQAEEVIDEQGKQISFTKETLRFVTDAIKQFRLRYQLPIAGSFYAIVDRFPKEQPNLNGYFNKKDAGTLMLEFSFSGLLPRSIMPNIIAKLHDDITQNLQDEELVWRYGVILEHETDQAKACWTVDYQKKSLTLWVQGDDAEKYLQTLRDEVQKIFDAIKGLSISTSSSSDNGDNKQKGSGDIVLNVSAKKAVAVLQESLAAIKLYVEKYDADFFVRVSAYGDLQRIDMHLGGIEKAPSDPEHTLQLLLNSIEDDTLGVMKLAKEIKAADETVVQLKQNAREVSALLAGSF